MIAGLLVKGTSASREALRYVAQDPRTIPSLSTMINETIGADAALTVATGASEPYSSCQSAKIKRPQRFRL